MINEFKTMTSFTDKEKKFLETTKKFLTKPESKNSIQIEANTFISKKEKRKIVLTIDKNITIAETQDNDKCAIFVNGSEFIIDISFEEMLNIKQALLL